MAEKQLHLFNKESSNVNLYTGHRTKKRPVATNSDGIPLSCGVCGRPIKKLSPQMLEHPKRACGIL